MALSDLAIELRKALNFEPRLGYLGNGSGDPRDRNLSGNYYVRLQGADGSLTAPVSMPVDANANITPTDGFAVLVGYDEFGTQVILKAYREGVLAAGVNPLTLNPKDDAANGFVQTKFLPHLYCTRHADVTNKPLTVSVFPAFIDYGDTITYAGMREIDLSDLVPSAGLKVLAVVLLRPDNTLEAFASDTVTTSDPVTITLFQSALSQRSAGSIPVWGWVLQDAQTVLSEDARLNIDLRQYINTTSASVPASALYLAWRGLSI